MYNDNRCNISNKNVLSEVINDSRFKAIKNLIKALEHIRTDITQDARR